MEQSVPLLEPSEDDGNTDSDRQKLEKGYNYGRSLLRLLGINALVCGVEIVSSAGFTYIPPLLLKSGFSETSMTIILGIAPFLDMITVPLLAEWSDTCTSSLGRRRPFILFLSTLLLISLVMVPYGPTISTVLFGSTKINMLTLAAGVVLLDYSYQALFNPCESLLSDLVQKSSESEQTLGFTIYSACISLGCILGYLVVSIDWKSFSMIVITQEQTAFTVIFLLFLPCVFLTLLTAKESPYVSISKFSNTLTVKKDMASLELGLKEKPELDTPKDNPSDGGYESGSGEDDTIPMISSHTQSCLWRILLFAMKYRSPLKLLKFLLSVTHRLIVKLLKCIIFLPFQCIRLPLKCWNRVYKAPVVLKRLFLAELFSWTGFMCHNMFFTDFVGQYVYGGSPDAAEFSEKAILYDEGVRMASWGLFLHSTTACLYAFFLQQYAVHYFGQRLVFLGGLGTFVIAVILTIVSPTITFLNFVTALSGIGFAALTTTPNMLVTLYNSDRHKYMWDCQSKKETLGLGTDVAVLDTAYFLAQIILSLFMGPLVDLTRSSLPYMIVSFLAGIVAVYCSTKVVFNEHDIVLLRSGKF